MNLSGEALDLYRSGSNCAQSVMVPYLPTQQMDEGAARALGAGLGGGLGGTQETCGALNGGAIVLSNAAARGGDPDPGARVALLVESFRSQFGTARCRELLGYDRNDPASVSAAPSDAKAICARCVEYVARYLDRELDRD